MSNCKATAVYLYDTFSVMYNTSRREMNKNKTLMSKLFHIRYYRSDHLKQLTYPCGVVYLIKLTSVSKCLSIKVEMAVPVQRKNVQMLQHVFVTYINNSHNF